MTADGLHLTPFRGLRYVPGRVTSLAAVTSPPYDVVVRPDGLHHLETADPYNIVRLTLPQDSDPAAAHRKAAATLRRWRSEGVLAVDAQPALYVYEQRRAGVLQRGLIGSLRLTCPEERVVLPHEDVIPEVVADRAALMRETETQPEPLLLSYRGDGPEDGAASVIERATQRHPLLSTTTEDGFAHRLWAVTDPAELATVETSLARHRALIADGHHRWATYLRLRSERAEGPHSPWNYGLVLLVDTARYPHQVQAIHRVLPSLPPTTAVKMAQDAFRVRTLHLPLQRALAALEETPGNAFLLTEREGTFHLIDRPSPALLARTAREGRPESWRTLDATVLHEALIDRVWGIPDSASEISYIHDARAAVEQAEHHGGTAVLMRPVPEETVRTLAERGVTMPRKSTSFGPKPATGLVLRTMDGTAH